MLDGEIKLIQQSPGSCIWRNRRINQYVKNSIFGCSALCDGRELRTEASQDPDEADGNPVHLLRHPHGKRGAAGGQNRTESTPGGLPKRKHAHRKVLSQGNYASIIENGQKIRPKRPE